MNLFSNLLISHLALELTAAFVSGQLHIADYLEILSDLGVQIPEA